MEANSSNISIGPPIYYMFLKSAPQLHDQNISKSTIEKQTKKIVLLTTYGTGHASFKIYFVK